MRLVGVKDEGIAVLEGKLLAREVARRREHPFRRRAGRHREHDLMDQFRRPPVLHMNNSAWQSARARAADKWEEQTGTSAPEGFRRVRVHDMKHTFGRRLRAAGVSFEDRQDLLGHKSARITTHYSGPELANLIAAAEKVCEDKKFPQIPAKIGLRRRME